MKTEEANKIISEFMGWEQITTEDGCKYVNTATDMLQLESSESLDALVPVWEKLNSGGCLINWSINAPYFLLYREIQKDEIFAGSHGETIQQAAAIATAKAIQELEK